MPLDAAQIVFRSFEGLSGSMGAFSASFYDRLFARAPAVRGMFPDDMTRQRQHLAAAVAIVARNADRIEDLADTLRELGARHAEFGTRPEHYPLVMEVLMETLASSAGPGWDGATEGAWRAVFGRVCALMIEGGDSRDFLSRRRPVAADPSH